MIQTLQGILEEGEAILKRANISEADLNAWYLFSYTFNIDKVHYLMDRRIPLIESQLIGSYAEYLKLLERRARRIPLQYLIGTQEFMGLDFIVNEHVLIPRQDTETLVEIVLKENANPQTKVLDICTGSGCIAISLAKLGNYSLVTASDLSSDALKVAGLNCEKNHCSQVELLESDLFEHINGTYDIIVSNPPYIPTDTIKELEPEVRDYEPTMALDGWEDGYYFYRILATECYKYLKQSGRVYFEIGHNQGSEVSNLLREQGYIQIQVIKDAAGLDRVVKAALPN